VLLVTVKDVELKVATVDVPVAVMDVTVRVVFLTVVLVDMVTDVVGSSRRPQQVGTMVAYNQ